MTGALADLLEPFERILREGRALPAGRPIVGSLCNFAPDELALAAGAIPVRLDRGRGARASPLSTDICCAVRALAAGPHPLVPEVDLLVVPTACDGKQKLAPHLLGARAIHLLEIPASKRTETAQAHWRDQIARLAARIEALTGARLRRRNLLQAVALTNRRTELFRSVLELRRSERPPLTGRQLFTLVQASFLGDPSRWNALVEALLPALRSAEGPRPRARLLLTGSPILWPDFALLDAVLAAGADIVADETCAGTERLYHPTVLDEPTRGGLLRALAERTLLPCTCPCFQETDDRLDRLAERIERFRVDGVVLHLLRGCQAYAMDAARVQSFVAGRGVPVLTVHLELDEIEGGLQNRVDAFVEMLAG